MNYKTLLQQVRVAEDDFERKALFYIIANKESLLKRLDKIYNIESGSINIDYIKSDDVLQVEDSAVKLLFLGLNMYNGYTDPRIDISINAIATQLDKKEYAVMLKALEIRYPLFYK